MPHPAGPAPAAPAAPAASVPEDAPASADGGGASADGGAEPGGPGTVLGLRETKKRHTRIAMHRAALELVAEQGAGRVTVEMIARRAGVSTRTFFNHWATKEAAVLGMAGGEGRRAGELLADLLETLPPRAALRAVIRQLLAEGPEDHELRDLKKQVMRQEPHLHAVNAGNLHQVQIEFEQVLAEHLGGEDARARATASVHVATALARSAFAVSMARGLSLPEAFDEVLAMFDGDLLTI